MNYEKLDKRIEHMLEHENDNYLININLKDSVSDKLLSYQYLHVFNIICSINYNHVTIDGSDTGTGKTYSAIAACKQLNLRPFIICPKTIMSNWKKVCDYFNVKPLSIANYETVKYGKHYDKNRNRVDSYFIEMRKTIIETKRKGKIVVKEDVNYKWKLPNYGIVIFDEVHKSKSPLTLNGKLLMSTKNIKNKVLLLSATLSDKPKSFHIFGYMLGFYKNLSQGKNWINGMLREDKNRIGTSDKLSAIGKKIYPGNGSRISISDLGNKFPKNHVVAEVYDISPEYEDEVNQLVNFMSDGYKEVQPKKDNKQILAKITKARQKLEDIKLPIIKEQVEEYLENGYSVVIFVNFNRSLEKLANTLKTKCVIRGDQDISIREKNISDFQNNKERLIICNLRTGGLSISLHDLYGVPRVSLISPSFSSIDLIQALGRIHRAEAMTPALQRLIYCANTIEELICIRINDKLKFTSKINDEDLIELKMNTNKQET